MNVWDWIADDLGTSRLTYGKVYDPDKYELKPKKEYIDTLIGQKKREIDYHEEKAKSLRDDIARLEKLKQEG